MKTIIIAAGQGSRLWKTTDRVPKTLLPLGDGTVLSRIVANFVAVGVNEFVIVVGFRSEFIVEYLERNGYFGKRFTIVENREWERGNGISVLRAQAALAPGETALLSMSDHLVSSVALARIKDAPGDRNLLLTDDRIAEVFDLDDATKVKAENGTIVDIGKELADYNALDCGIFRINARFFAALQEQIAQGRESISDAVQVLVRSRDMGIVEFPADARWIDVDTPEAYRHVLAHLGDFDPTGGERNRG
jgi:choline kinase